MTHFAPVKKNKVHNGYLCHTPVQIRGKTVYLQCNIENMLLPRTIEISMVGDILNTKIKVELKDLYTEIW